MNRTVVTVPAARFLIGPQNSFMTPACLAVRRLLLGLVLLTVARAEATTLWLSTQGAAVATGASPTSWSSNQVVAFDNPGLTYGRTNTWGTFRTVFGFNPPADIRAMHYVNVTNRVGNPGTDYELIPGDLLITFNVLSATTFGTVSNVLRSDVLLYRPGAGGNYTNGTYYMLLNSPIVDGATRNIHALSLVEQDTMVGGKLLTKGTFLVCRSDPAKHMNVYTFRPTSVGPGTTAPSTGQLLVDGGRVGIGAQIQGVELLETPIVLGNTNLPRGLLLMSINSAGNINPSAENLAVEAQDIFTLNLTKTEQDTVPGTVGTTAMLFDGSSVGLDANSANERLNAFTLFKSIGPTISLQPTNQSVPFGGNATFRVAASGSTDLAYQWRLNGQNLTNATNATLQLTGVVSAEGGAYSVLVANPAWSVVSSNALLTVILPPTAPSITNQPASFSAAVGTNVTLSAGIGGNGPFLYQWRLNGVNIAGATNATLTLNNLQGTNAGSYSLTVYNDLGSVVTDPATLTVLVEELLLADAFSSAITRSNLTSVVRGHNVGATMEVGEPWHASKVGGRSVWVTWKATASGIATYSTRGSGLDTLLAVYTGESVDALDLIASDDDSGGFLSSRVQFNAEAGTLYHIAVDTLGGTEGEIVLTWSLVATPESIPVITLQPQSQTTSAGSDVTYMVTATGTNLTFQWWFNDQPIPGANQASLTITNAVAADAGEYRVRVSRGSRTVESDYASLELNLTEGRVQAVRTSVKYSDEVWKGEPLRLQSPGSVGLKQAGSLARGYTGTQIFSTKGAVKEPGEPNHCGVPGGASHWFSLVPDRNGTLFLSTDGSNFDTVMAVYTGTATTVANLTPVACDNNSGSNRLTSALSFNAVSNTIYYIAVDGVNGVSGTVVFNYSLAIPSELLSVEPGVSGNNRVRVLGQARGNFRLQASTNLTTWTTLLSTNSSSGAFDYLDDAFSTLPVRYYRVLTLPWP